MGKIPLTNIPSKDNASITTNVNRWGTKKAAHWSALKTGRLWTAFSLLLPNKNIGNLVVQKESGDPIRRML